MEEGVIYAIKNRSNNKVYIGSSVNYRRRKTHHLSRLKANDHENSHLQRAYNKYGKDSFLFNIIETVSNRENIIIREQYWIDYHRSYNRNFGYNLQPKAYSNLGNKHSEETKAKISVLKKGKKWTERQIISRIGLVRRRTDKNRGKNNKLSKPILRYDLNNNIVDAWEAINVCATTLNFDKSSIIRCLKGRMKQTQGFTFKYKET